MREIKFRVWDIINKRILNYGEIMHLPMWEVFPGTPEQRAFNVMQYTGLKDKHGKEIYEGDVVKYTLKSYYNKTVTEMIPVTWGSYSDGGEYVDNVECWMIRYKSLSDICDNKYNQSVEVIGNIYENPELLEG
ncbi:YopX family protein [Clostridium culturomicium]|uniref:YopX family protein n=1 Tax=Clostridium culturomicium TaxID=1499683 RepID=UPI00058B91FA|nr:YopX family protein [Clostridium culturomicium]